MRSAVGFFTHLCDPEIISRYRKLKADLVGRAETSIVALMGTKVPKDLLAETVFFDFAQLAAAAPRILGSKVIPGNCHLTMLAFFRERPGFDHYWHIEYDVIFTGGWHTLLDAWSNDASDLVAPHVRTRGEEPDWPWWSSLQVPPEAAESGYVRAFLPVYRISRRALERLEAAVQEGSSGHFEALVPTVLQSASLRISDLGEGRFYTSASSPDGLVWTKDAGFRAKAEAFFHDVTDRIYPVQGGKLDYWEVTAIYAAGTYDTTTTWRGKAIPEITTPGVWPLIPRMHGKGILGMVDYISSAGYYGLMPMLPYEHGGGIYYNHDRGGACQRLSQRPGRDTAAIAKTAQAIHDQHLDVAAQAVML